MNSRILPQIVGFTHLPNHFISQYPLFGEPCRIRMPHFLSFLILASTFLLEIPIVSAIFFAESCAFRDNNSSIWVCVLFKLFSRLFRRFPDVSLIFTRYFSDASPMLLRCHYHLLFPKMVCDKDLPGTYRQKPGFPGLEVHTVLLPVLFSVFLFPMLQ